jgi:hypothetical protein
VVARPNPPMAARLPSIEAINNVGFCFFVFGREFLFGANRCAIIAETVPDFEGAVSVETLTPLRKVYDRGLRHSVYNDPAAALHIMRWLFPKKMPDFGKVLKAMTVIPRR